MKPTIVIGQPHTFKAGESCDGFPHDATQSPTNRAYYTPSETLLSQEHLDWFKSKTGFTMPKEFYQYFLSVPRLLTSHLPLPVQYDTGDNSGSLGGIAFCHSNGDIFQYRPPNAKPAKYLAIVGDKLSEGVKEKVGIKPLFIPALNPRDGKRILVVTEGVTKAASISYIGFDCLHINGVTNWNTSQGKQALSIAANYDAMVLAFDVDFHTNPAVKKQLMKMCQAYGALVADWSQLSKAKGFDDLMLEIGSDDIKLLRSFILDATKMDDGYFISDRDRPYVQMAETVQANFPSLYFDGTYWVNNGEVASSTVIKVLLIQELQKFYTVNKFGQQFMWGTRYNEPLDWLKMVLTKESSSSALYLQNGIFSGGVFTPTAEPDPRAVNWSYNPDLADPIEVINFIKKCHGNEDYRLWMRSTLDNSIQLGAILGVMGASGSGKSVTLSIAQSMMRALDVKSTPLTQLDKIERVASLGFPRLIIQSDCQRFPEDTAMMYQISSGEPIDVRMLYHNETVQRKLHARIAFGCVNLPYISSANGGFDRRFRQVLCKSYPEIGNDAAALEKLLKEPTYIERLANWCLKADTAKTKQFMFINQDDDDSKVGISVTSNPIYFFLDKVLVVGETETDVPVEDVYEGYVLYSRRNERKPQPMHIFLDYLKKLKVAVTPGLSIQNPDGSFLNEPDTIGCKVDVRANAIFAAGVGSFKGIDNRYFKCREMAAKKAVETPKIISIAYDETGVEVLSEDSFINPTVATINSQPQKTRYVIIDSPSLSHMPTQISKMLLKQKSPKIHSRN